MKSYIQRFVMVALLLIVCMPTVSVAIQCYDCHGTSNPVDYRPVDTYYRNLSTGGFLGNHRTHLDSSVSSSSCSICHPGSGSYTTSHRDILIKVSSRINSSPLITLYKNSTTAWFQSATPTMGTCSNVNCHFEAETPIWGSNPALTTCTTCHGAPPSGTASTYIGGAAGSHAKHDQYYPGTTNCQKCHANNTTFQHATSAGKRALKISFTAAPNNGSGLYNGALNDYLPSQINNFGNCTATYCHSPGTKATAFNPPSQAATWGGTLGCAGCHDATPTTGSHRTHLDPAYSYGVPVACYKCHSATVTPASTIYSTTNHVNNKVDIAFNSTTTATFGKYSGHFTPIQKNPGSGYANCENVYCHSNGQGAGGSWPPTYSAPKWGVSTTGKCGTCHDDGYHSGVTKISSGSHARHMSYGFASGSTGCGNCHYGAGFVNKSCNQCHYGSDTNLTAMHINHRVDVSFLTKYGGAYSGTPELGDGYSSCSNVYCHSNGTSITTGSIPANTSTVWGSGTLACSGCHGNPPSYANDTPKTNSHVIHASYSCNKCHYRTTTNATTITNTTNHVNQTYDVYSGAGARFAYSYNAGGGTCSSISCHGTTNSQWGSTSCLGCHSVTQGNRAAITSQFSAGSHHIQGAITDAKCYQCHWEANSDGTINQAYHNAAVSGSAVDLVVYGADRPAVYSLTGTVTAVQYHYTTSVNRAGVQKITTHCLGCHSSANDGTTPFADGRTPKQYAWDGTSIAARYSQTGTTTWGKYSTVTNAAQKRISKAYSAHGNSLSNRRYWDSTNGVDGDMSVQDTSGTVNVNCYDCHNSHGSTVAGITSQYSSATGRNKGAILKDTVAGKGGYSVAYKPYTGGSTANKNKRNPGASLCLDCHMSSSATSTPWGYNTTFGSTQAIQGYWDTPYFGPGTFGSQSRYNTFKNAKGHQGGHFGASASLSPSNPAVPPIGGLCTPCHDPHGVTDNTAKIAAADKQYAVPLLKGTFMTSPYKEDVSPASATVTFGGGGYEDGAEFNGASHPAYNIDQSTFANNWFWGSAVRVSEDVNKFGGLCLQCHAQSSLNPNAGSSNYAWRSMNRVHNTVKGWGGQGANTGNAKHSFTCSKCHTAHNSRLPRLMVSNCLDYTHRGRVVTGGQAGSGSASASGGNGEGKYPGGGQGTNGSSGFGGVRSGVACHDNTNADGWPNNQLWNTVTLWGGIPKLASPTASSIDSTSAILGADLITDGGTALTARGTVWGTSANPNGNAVAEGGTTTGVFSHARTSITSGTKIYYRGYATSSAGTGYSPDGSFYTEPSAQASAVTFTSVGNAGMTVNWTRGIGGDGVIVLMRQGSAVVTDPADGTYTTYTANAAFGSGTAIGEARVIFKGSGTSVSVTGLTGGATYYVAVYEYKGSVDTSGVNQGTNYKLTPVTGSQATSAPTTPILTSPTATAIGSGAATLGANVTSDGGAVITARGTVWGTTANPTGNVVAEGGTTTGTFTHARTSITSGTKIYYRGYATNSMGTAYSADGSFYAEPSTQASAVNFTAVSDTGMTVNWTRGSGGTGGGVIVLMRQGSAVTGTPADGTYTGYNPNAVFGSGTLIGNGYVVYKGTGTSVAVTGLTSGATYYLVVFEFAGQTDTSGLDQGTNYKPTPTIGNRMTNTSPILTTPTATSIGSSTATLGANVTSDGGTAITARGTVWGTSANPTGNVVAEGGTTTGTFSHARASITSGTKIYYRGYATNSVGTAYSADGSFYTEPLTQASAVNFTLPGDTGMTVNWTRGDGDGVIVLMRQGSGVSTDPADGTYTTYTANAAFGSGTAIGSAYVVYKGVGTSVPVTGLSSGSTYYAAAYEYKGTLDTSGVNQGVNYKPTAATGSQATSGLVPPNPPTLNVVTVCNTSICSETCQNTLTWNSGGGGDIDAKQYYVEMDTTSSFNSVNLTNSGWLAADITTWVPTVHATTWYWRVKARDSVHTTAVSEWSSTANWTFTDGYYYAPDCTCDDSCGVTCPILFTWDGEKYFLETDIYPAGKLGNRDPSGFRKPSAHDYYLLEASPETKNDKYELRLVEEKIEINYFDSLKLYAVDAPANRVIYSERLPVTGGRYIKPEEVLHTTAKELKTPLSVKHVETGEDITGRLSGKEYVVLSKHRNNDFGWQTLEIDLGDLSDAPMIKLIIDGSTSVPNNHEGHIVASKWLAKSRLQVLDEKGNWVTVPMKQRSIMPRDGGGPVAVNITNLFKTKVYKLRLQYLYKTYIRYIRFDTTVDEPLIAREVPFRSAELQYHGHDDPVSAVNVKGEVVKYTYGNDSGTSPRYLPGYYTRYGDVAPLLKNLDDKFVIFGSGDEIVLEFDPVTPVRNGLSRRFLLYSNGYYKSTNNRNVPSTVEPLPYSGMSNFPYDENVESYPKDKEHQDYRDQYNTRMEDGRRKEGKANLVEEKKIVTTNTAELKNIVTSRYKVAKPKTAEPEIVLKSRPPLQEMSMKALSEGKVDNGMSESKSSIWLAVYGYAVKLLALVAVIWGWIVHALT